MRRAISSAVVLAVLFGVSATGCGKGTPAVSGTRFGSKKANSSSEVIQKARGITAPKEKKEYMIEQAQNFLDEGKYRHALEVSEYILKYLDVADNRARGIRKEASDRLFKKNEEA